MTIKHQWNLGVSAEEISDSRQLLKLVNRKFDVTSITSTRLIDLYQ